MAAKITRYSLQEIALILRIEREKRKKLAVKMFFKKLKKENGDDGNRRLTSNN